MSNNRIRICACVAFGLAPLSCSRELPPERAALATREAAEPTAIRAASLNAASAGDAPAPGASAAPMAGSEPSAVRASSTDRGVAVVELFTSEGCSSCPPADRVLASLTAHAKAAALPVFTLSFHVDYWNYLGWRDPFSSSSYSARQQDYSGISRSGGTYTPQVVVNGEAECVGSDRSRIDGLIDSALKRAPRTGIAIEARRAARGVEVSYRVSGATAGRVLNLALLEPNAESQVKNGENAGERLAHVNVVRSFASRPLGDAASGSLTLPITAELDGQRLGVVAYAEGATQRDISGATSLVLP